MITALKLFAVGATIVTIVSMMTPRVPLGVAALLLCVVELLRIFGS